jgi:pyruvate/2-oxoglutarate dehydrogenase complex dihydrolipoamide dehydrogenase (E3) component
VPDYDVIVLGGGSAGSSAAAAASSAGARTAMVNDGELGGLCILRGCMPTKSMLAAAHAIHEAEHLEPFAARLDGRVVPDFAGIMARKDGHVARFKRAKVAAIESEDYEVIAGRGRFTGEGVAVGDTRLSARAYVIATGSVPEIAPLPGIDDVPLLTSDGVMRLEEAPRRLIVQGTGPIGLELAQFFARVGSEVLLVGRSPLLWRYDTECGDELRRALEAEPRLELAVPARIDGLARDGDGLRATLASPDGTREVAADALLMAAGRRAALEDLGLEHVCLEPRDGRLDHDAWMRTSRPEIYVAGDATGSYQILHLANQEGVVAGHNAAGGDPPRAMSYRLKMNVIFTDPPFAQVGLSEREALEQGHTIRIGRARFPETGRAITMETGFGLWKLMIDERSREILGSSILGPRADDLVHLVAIMMRYDARVDEIVDLPWYHPTLSEVMLNLARDLPPTP